MKYYFSTAPILFALLAGAVYGQGGAASIAGSVVTDAGNPAAGALVTAMAVPSSIPPPAGFVPATATAFAANDGTFSIGNLAAGKYQLCAQTQRAAGLLDPCVWSQTQTYATVTAGQALKSQKITMTTGTLLKVHFNDPGGLLLANEGKTAGAGVIVSVGGTVNVPMPLFVDVTTATGRDQSVAVPLSTALKVLVYSSFYKLADASGNAFVGTYQVPVTIAPTAVGAAGTLATTITLNITGVQGH